MPMTQVEQWFLDECLRGQTMLVKKMVSCAQQASDPQLRQLCQELAQAHRRQFDLLASQIG
ncbi:MAG: hypothetical protein IRY95_03895 [Clostridia bacterium]|nr:hypothetical protein [Clostridia bacterium]